MSSPPADGGGGLGRVRDGVLRSSGTSMRRHLLVLLGVISGSVILTVSFVSFMLMAPSLDEISLKFTEEVGHSLTEDHLAMNAFEGHYLSKYRSMMLARDNSNSSESKKFILFQMSTHGLGNKIRTLSGAIFLAAILDRVLLVDSKIIANLFEPPILNGTVLDWNLSLANGMCEEGSGTAHRLNMSPKRSKYTPHFVSFHQQYSNISCLIVGSSFGHDRQVATLNEDAYKKKIERLFGHPSSRYNWSKMTNRLIQQRPKIAVVNLMRKHAEQLGMLQFAAENRIAVHFRSFADMDETTTKSLLDAKETFWDCVVPLVQEIANATAYGKVVLVVSDSQDIKNEAKQRLGSISQVKVIDAGLDVVHIDETNAAALNATNYLEWFLLGECGSVISTGYSSFGITGFMRPALLPPTETENKRLFTVDGLLTTFMGSNGNNACGEIKATGYDDLNIGIYDPKHKGRGMYLGSRLGNERGAVRKINIRVSK